MQNKICYLSFAFGLTGLYYYYKSKQETKYLSKKYDILYNEISYIKQTLDMLDLQSKKHNEPLLSKNISNLMSINESHINDKYENESIDNESNDENFENDSIDNESNDENFENDSIENEIIDEKIDNESNITHDCKFENKISDKTQNIYVKDLSNWSLLDLKKYAKSVNLKGYSTMKKNDLINVLRILIS